MGVEIEYLQARALNALPPLAQCTIHRIVFKYEESFEESCAARHVAPGLNVQKRRVLVLPRFHMLGLQSAQPRKQLLTGWDSYAGGEWLAEPGDQPIHARNFR